MHLSPKRLDTWEVTDHKEITPVPAYFDDSEVDVVSISPNDISQTYTFDRPLYSTQSPPSSPCKKASGLKSKLHLARTVRRTSNGLGGSAFRRFSYTSTSSASSSDSEPDSPPSSVTSLDHPDPSDFSTSQMQHALIFARTQLLNSSEFRKTGGNVLFFEGWSITKFRKGHHTRIQVVYTGRPAVAKYYYPHSIEDSTPALSPPPFMDVLGDSW